MTWWALAVLLLWGDAAPAPAQAPAPPLSGPRELFALYGFDESYFEKLPPGTAFDEDQVEPVLRGLYALRRFSRVDVARWKQPSRHLAIWLSDPTSHAGEIVKVRGRLKQVTRVKPPEEVARRFDLPVYYRCDLELAAPSTPATVFALAVPKEWLPEDVSQREMEARVGFQGVFLKSQSTDKAAPNPLFLTQRVQWFSEEGNYATLGNLGFDRGLVDGVRDKTALADSGDLEREAFYQLLDTVNRTAPGELHAIAATEIRNARKIWEADLVARKGAQPADVAARGNLERRLERAQDEADDVVPLFNAPAEVRGKLFTVVGAARRAVEIRVDDPDIRERFGLDHYYEVEVVTPDSRGNPLAFCLRELPAEMPIGENLNEPVRASGFFLKSWGFRTAESAESAPGTVRKQLAPLLIGRDLVWLNEPAAAETPRSWLYGGVLGAAAFAIGIAWWLMRDVKVRDRKLPNAIDLPGEQPSSE